MFIGTFTSLYNPVSSGTQGLVTLVAPPSSYSTPSSGGGISVYQSPGGGGGGGPAQGLEFSDLPVRRFPGVFGEEFDQAGPLGALFNNRNAALLAIGVFGFLLLKEK